MRAIQLRIAVFLATVWLIVTVGFVCVYKLPGDPARMILGRQASQQTVDDFKRYAGLDQPLWQQYGNFVRRAASGDYGESLLYRRPVTVLIRERSRPTLLLVLYSFGVVLLAAFVVPLAFRLLSAPRFGAPFQILATALGIAPPYILGVVLLAVFAGALGWVSVIFDSGNIKDWILPAVVLAAYPTSVVLRLFDSELGKVLHATYVLRARAMGFGTRQVLLLEALPNALTAALPALANAVAVFITGTFFVEVIFGIPGLGRLTYEAIANKDIALLSALCLVFAFAISSISVMLDLARLMIDPRLRERHA